MCNTHGQDDYCYPSRLYGSGHRNKEITFSHNWDQRANRYPQGDGGVIDDYSPRGGDLSDISVTDSRSVDVGVNIDNGGTGLGAGIGWSQSINRPASNYRDLTNWGENVETLHKLEMEVSSDAAKDAIEGYIGTLAHFYPDCKNSSGVAEAVCEIDIDFVFAPPVFKWLGTGWGRFEEKNTESFRYLYGCPCTNPPCPTFR